MHAASESSSLPGPDATKNQAPIPPTRGFIERNLGTILTFITATLAAYVSFSGGLFKANEPPTARIAVMLGNQKAAIAESGSSPATTVNVVPVGRPLNISGAASRDTNGGFEKVRFAWSINELLPKAASLVTPKRDDVTLSAADRLIEWTPPSEGVFEILLDVTNDQGCNLIVRFVVGAGCHKTASAVLHLSARTPAKPVPRTQITPTSGSQPYNYIVDATHSTGFDGGTSADLRFDWKVDGDPYSEASTFTLGFPASNGDQIEHHVLTGEITDAWGMKTSFERRFDVGAQNKTAASRPQPEGGKAFSKAAAPVEANGAQRVEEAPTLLAKPYEVDDSNVELRLPKRMITNGFPVTVKNAKLVRADDAEIVAFPDPLPPGRAGAPGMPGSGGVGYGAPGLPGFSGQSGEAGVDGSGSGGVTINAGAFAGRLTVRAAGMPGGAGGDGGAGGTGGPGARGEPSSSSIFDCKSGPGRGGDGGAGGRGGSGGRGGRGGQTGNVDLSFAETAPGAKIVVAADAASGGARGMGGSGGLGGAGGSEGDLSGHCGSAGRAGREGQRGGNGLAGQLGPPGTPGTVTLKIGDATSMATGSLSYP